MAAIMGSQPVISRGDALPVLEPAEHPLDDVSASVGCAIERMDDGPSRAAWNDGFDAFVLEPRTQAIRVTGFVGDEAFGRRQSLQQRHGHRDVGHVARRQRDGDDPATTIGQTMDFGCSAAARDADRLMQLPSSQNLLLGLHGEEPAEQASS